MWSHLLTSQDYQDLINRGWRRSGKYCYKPNNKRTCCPLYTIKCDAINFKLSKTHKKILKRMNKFLKDGSKNTEDGEKTPEPGETEKDGSGQEMFMTPNTDRAPATLCPMSEITEMDCVDGPIQSAVTNAIEIKPKRPESKPCEAMSGPDPNKPACKKAKELRLERKKAKLAEKGLMLPENGGAKANQEKTLEQFLAEEPTGDAAKHTLKFKLLAVDSDEYRRTLRTEFKLYVKYQTVVHDDPPSDISEFEEFLVDSPMEV